MVVEPGRVTQCPAVVPGPDRTPARDTEQRRERSSGYQSGQLVGGLVDLGVEVDQQCEVGGQDRARDRRVGSRQRIASGLDQPVRDRLADLQTPARAEPDEPGAAQGGESGWVGELGRDQPTHLGGQHVRQRQGQAGEGPIQLS